jgi:hypothetical protein
MLDFSVLNSKEKVEKEVEIPMITILEKGEGKERSRIVFNKAALKALGLLEKETQNIKRALDNNPDFTITLAAENNGEENEKFYFVNVTNMTEYIKNPFKITQKGVVSNKKLYEFLKNKVNKAMNYYFSAQSSITLKTIPTELDGMKALQIVFTTYENDEENSFVIEQDDENAFKL